MIPSSLRLRDRREAERRGLLVDRQQLLAQRHGVVEEPRVVGAEEQIFSSGTKNGSARCRKQEEVLGW